MTSIKSKTEKRYSKIRPSYIIIFKLQFPHTHKFSIFSKIPNHLLYFELLVSDICFMLLTKKIFFFAFDGAGRVYVSRDAAKMLLSTTICAFRMHQKIPMYFYIHSNLDPMYIPQNCSVGGVKFCITSLLQIFLLSHF